MDILLPSSLTIFHDDAIYDFSIFGEIISHGVISGSRRQATDEYLSQVFWFKLKR